MCNLSYDAVNSRNDWILETFLLGLDYDLVFLIFWGLGSGLVCLLWHQEWHGLQFNLHLFVID